MESTQEQDRDILPRGRYATPDEIVAATDFSRGQKMGLLRQWDQDARQNMIAAKQGMPVSNDNQTPEILRAIRRLLRGLGASEPH